MEPTSLTNDNNLNLETACYGVIKMPHLEVCFMFLIQCLHLFYIAHLYVDASLLVTIYTKPTIKLERILNQS